MCLKCDEKTQNINKTCNAIVERAMEKKNNKFRDNNLFPTNRKHNLYIIVTITYSNHL